MVQADRWLWHYHHRVFARLIGSDGCVTVPHEEYYLSTQLAGQKVALVVDAPTAAFDVVAATAVLKRLSIKNVVGGKMPLERFISLILEQAQSEERLRLAGISPVATGRVGPNPLTRGESAQHSLF